MESRHILVVKSKDLGGHRHTAGGEGGTGIKLQFLIHTTGWMVGSEKDQVWDRESQSGVQGTAEVGDNGQGGTKRGKKWNP